MKQERPIQKYEGVPAKPNNRGERARWKSFLGFFSRRLSAAEELGLDFAEARVDEARADADIKQNEAAERAAIVDQENAKATKACFDLIDETLDTENDLAKELKLAKLLETYPTLAKHLESILRKQQDLKARFGVRIVVNAANEADRAESGEASSFLPPPPGVDS